MTEAVRSLICPRCLTPIPADGAVVYVGAEKCVLHRSCYERRGAKAELRDAAADPGARDPRSVTNAAREAQPRDAGDESGALEGLVGWLHRSHRTLRGR